MTHRQKKWLTFIPKNRKTIIIRWSIPYVVPWYISHSQPFYQCWDSFQEIMFCYLLFGGKAMRLTLSHVFKYESRGDKRKKQYHKHYINIISSCQLYLWRKILWNKKEFSTNLFVAFYLSIFVKKCLLMYDSW